MNAIEKKLEPARRNHNEDCLFCAIKDTAIDEALALFRSQPSAGEGKRLIKQALGLLYDTMHPTPKVAISNILSRIELIIDRQEAELKDKDAESKCLKSQAEGYSAEYTKQRAESRRLLADNKRLNHLTKSMQATNERLFKEIEGLKAL